MSNVEQLAIGMHRVEQWLPLHSLARCPTTEAGLANWIVMINIGALKLRQLLEEFTR